MLLRRDLKSAIIESAQYFPVVAILGPCQSGKTTLAQMIFERYTYVTLEDLDMRVAAVQDPRTFLIANRREYGVIIDEFQYVPELLSYIQTMVDREKKQGYFILIGSQNFLMNEKITQSLAGRVAIHTLLPLSIHELSENKILPEEMEPMLYKGSYPAIYAKNTPPALLYSNYFQTYIERDVRQLTQVGDLMAFQTFVMLCAARIGQLLNLTSLANECNISDHTAKRWISILQASYIVFLLPPYHNNFGKRLVKSPKIFFYDTGLVCNLLKIKEEELALYPHKGNIFESLIISEILKWHYNNGHIPNIYFWRDSADHEVDCLIEFGKKLVAVEVKAGRTMNDWFFKGISDWNKIAGEKQGNGFVIYGGSAQQAKTRSNILSWQSIDEIFASL